MSIYPDALRILFNICTFGFMFGLGLFGGKGFCFMVGPYVRFLFRLMFRKVFCTVRRFLTVHFQEKG